MPCNFCKKRLTEVFNIRFYVLLFSILLSVFIYFYITSTTSESSLQIIKLTQTYALAAITYLYLTLLASPLTKIFTFLPFRGQYIKARRALGVSTFYFGLLHGLFAFFGELGGFTSLANLPPKYLLAISLSFTALVILTLMASTAFDFMIDKLGFAKWKMLHRLVYLAAVFIIIHALLLGSHFQNLSGIIPKIFLIALAILLILESIRIYQYFRK